VSDDGIASLPSLLNAGAIPGFEASAPIFRMCVTGFKKSNNLFYFGQKKR
jgi:hypothetical protein